jgi:glycosyltransferase involved in cell wall biosynthesis
MERYREDLRPGSPGAKPAHQRSVPALRRDAPAPVPKVAICIPTYRRPALLSALLESLARLELSEPAPDVLVVVVENQPEGYVPRIVAEHAGLPWPVITGMEPTRNIALARNKCIALALDHGADWVAFVDDDEQVTPRWLEELLRVQRAFDADVVGGTVINSYHEAVPRWIADGQLPRRRHHPTGTDVGIGETSNVLISRRVLELVPGRFDVRFGRSGGSDTHFFLRARSAGARIVWADDAIVHETFASSRTTLRWLLRRAFRTGNATVWIARALYPAHRWLPRRLAAACYRLSMGLLVIVPAMIQGRSAIAGALEHLFIAFGTIAGLAGYHFIEYEQSHGE